MGNNAIKIFGSTYFGPVNYFSSLWDEKEIIIEQYDNYSKQTYRNRCKILGANGIQNLVIPVKKVYGTKTMVKDILIDYDTDWQKNHYRSILSAYRSSPFFDFYFDDYQWVFIKKTEFLIDLNSQITELIMKQLGLNIAIRLSQSFTKQPSSGYDYRDLFHPKKTGSFENEYKSSEYTQVFSDRYGFIGNLSILDLIFNTGPEAILHLKNTHP